MCNLINSSLAIMDIDLAWTTIENSLIHTESGSNHKALLPALQCAVETVIAAEEDDFLYLWFWDAYSICLREEIVPEFWKGFDPNEEDTVLCMLARIKQIESSLIAWQSSLEILKKASFVLSLKKKRRWLDVDEHAKCLLQSILLSSVPMEFHETMKNFYSTSLLTYHGFFTAKSEECDNSDCGEFQLCLSCKQLKATCKCNEQLDMFHEVNRILRELNLLEVMSEEAVCSLVDSKVTEHVRHTCQGNFENSFIAELEQWLEESICGWLNCIYYGTRTPTCRLPNCPVARQRARLNHHVFSVYADVHIEQLFNIIIEYPESAPAILDLKVCLEKSQKRSKLISSLKDSLKTRLLHPGVNTNNILTAYCSAIRALRTLDPSGVILDLVCKPVKAYLKKRDDTVRCVMRGLTDDIKSDLWEELNTNPHSPAMHQQDKDWEIWEPDPIDADPGKLSAERRSWDVISMLVNIYGSKELFVNEYTKLLAERLLQQTSYETDSELRTLELLKVRFGESDLRNPEVMLKDVADSKRIFANINETRRQESYSGIQLSALILSEHYWPSLVDGKLELPADMRAAMDQYTKGFEALKGNRTLQWKPHLGVVEIDVELPGRTVNFSVAPVQAVILQLFENRLRWSLSDLSTELHVPSNLVKKKIALWQRNGLIKEEDGEYILVEEPDVESTSIEMEEDELESATLSASDQRQEELNVLWSYIVGMLTNIGSLSLDRIHTMLRMFASQAPSSGEVSLGELKAFLDQKVKQHLLTQQANMYSLAKN